MALLPEIVENEYHFLFRCEKYETVRPENFKHIKRHEEDWKFSEIMLCEEPVSTKQLALFVLKVFEIITKLPK